MLTPQEGAGVAGPARGGLGEGGRGQTRRGREGLAVRTQGISVRFLPMKWEEK